MTQQLFHPVDLSTSLTYLHNTHHQIINGIQYTISPVYRCVEHTKKTLYSCVGKPYKIPNILESLEVQCAQTTDFQKILTTGTNLFTKQLHETLFQKERAIAESQNQHLSPTTRNQYTQNARQLEWLSGAYQTAIQRLSVIQEQTGAYTQHIHAVLLPAYTLGYYLHNISLVSSNRELLDTLFGEIQHNVSDTLAILPQR
jgi:hypothetical protein